MLDASHDRSRRRRGDGVGRTRCPAVGDGDTPRASEPIVEIRVDELERSARSVGAVRPGAHSSGPVVDLVGGLFVVYGVAIPVLDTIDSVAEGVPKVERFARVAEAPREVADDVVDSGIRLPERGFGTRDDEEATRWHDRPSDEVEPHASPKRPTGEVDVLSAAVVKLDPLERVRTARGAIDARRNERRMEVNLVNHHRIDRGVRICLSGCRSRHDVFVVVTVGETAEAVPDAARVDLERRDDTRVRAEEYVRHVVQWNVDA